MEVIMIWNIFKEKADLEKRVAVLQKQMHDADQYHRDTILRYREIINLNSSWHLENLENKIRLLEDKVEKLTRENDALYAENKVLQDKLNYWLEKYTALAETED